VPCACAILADWGAEVIKVEDPGVGDSLRGLKSIEGIPQRNHIVPVFEVLNRGKRALAVNLRTKSGREIIYRLVQHCDVFASNFQSRVLDRLGMNYETLNKLNSKLIYATLTGYGEVAKDSDKPGYDYTAFWSRGGLMAKLGSPAGVPPSHRPGIGDSITSLCVTSGILADQNTNESQYGGNSADRHAVLALLHQSDIVNSPAADCLAKHCLCRDLNARVKELPVVKQRNQTEENKKNEWFFKKESIIEDIP
jgi:crotonobetainyl-CoA:carnitine CoA-transferase CaiB-like acyl-CoA transferase